jgi:hypothetical protein
MIYGFPVVKRRLMKKPIFAALLSLLPHLLAAQNVPALVNYQGQLANPDGSPLATANYELTFKIYSGASGGASVWGPQVFDGATGTGHGALVPVVQGHFNVILGPADINGNSLSAAFNNTNRFIEVTVTNHAPIAPRQQILTAPYAFLAASAGAAGLASNVVTGIVINSATITSPAINGAAIASSTISGAVINSSAISSSSTVPAASLTGTIASARLPADAAYLDVPQTFTAGQAFNANIGFGTNNPSAPVHAFSTGFPSALVDGSANAGTWFDLRNTAGGTNWHLIATGSGNGEGAGKLLFNEGPGLTSAGADVLTLTPGGKVGIGTSSPASALHVVGADYAQLQLQSSGGGHQWQIFAESSDNVLKFFDPTSMGYFYVTSGGAYNSSDRRLKKDIVPLGSVLDRALKLEPVSYRFKTAPDSSPKAIGFIAQDVEPLFPEVVSESAGMKGLAYGQMVTVAIGAVQELNQKVDAENARLREEVKQQAADNAELRARLEKLEQLVGLKALK